MPARWRWGKKAKAGHDFCLNFIIYCFATGLRSLLLYRPAVPAGPGWTPKELGLPKATALSVLLVAAIVGSLLFAGENFVPKPKPDVIQITQAQLVSLPKPTPPPPPKVVPPPKPLPALIPKPIPVPSKIVVATKPPPPVHHVAKPAPPPPPANVPTTAAPTPPAPAQPTSGLPIYGSQMHAILQANQDVPQALKTLGISGTAYVEIVVNPAGHAVSAKIYRSSGNPLIDQTCLDHALEANYGAFNAQMPNTSQAFIIPIEIQAENDN